MFTKIMGDGARVCCSRAAVVGVGMRNNKGLAAARRVPSRIAVSPPRHGRPPSERRSGCRGGSSTEASGSPLPECGDEGLVLPLQRLAYPIRMPEICCNRVRLLRERGERRMQPAAPPRRAMNLRRSIWPLGIRLMERRNPSTLRPCGELKINNTMVESH